MSKNRKCILCGKEYKFCSNCSDQHLKDETWRNIYCSENCKNIFNILSMNANGHVNDASAKDMLSKLDLTNLNQYREDFKQQINKIQRAEQPTHKFEEKPVVKQEDKFQKPFKPIGKKEFVKDDSKK